MDLQLLTYLLKILWWPKILYIEYISPPYLYGELLR